MPNRNKDRGTRWETEVVRYLRGWGFPARRVAQTGAYDEGDIHGVPDVVIQAKDVARHDLAGWCDDVAAQASQAHIPDGAVVIKRRGRSAARAYVVEDLETWARSRMRTQLREEGTMPDVRHAPSWTTFDPDDSSTHPEGLALVVVGRGFSTPRLARLRSVETPADEDDLVSVWEDEHGDLDDGMGYAGDVIRWYPVPDPPGGSDG